VTTVRIIRTLACALPVVAALCGCANVQANTEPWCRPANPTALMAESVPSATLLPCVASLPVGWEFAGFSADETHATFSIRANADTGGSVDVELRGACPAASSEGRRSDEAGTSLLRTVQQRSPYAATWIYRFEGGCARIDIAFTQPADVRPELAELRRDLSFLPREDLVASFDVPAG
jgi:hypothetical protein